MVQLASMIASQAGGSAQAAQWADRFTSNLPPWPAAFRRQAAGHAVRCVVGGASRALIPDPDVMLRQDARSNLSGVSVQARASRPAGGGGEARRRGAQWPGGLNLYRACSYGV